MLLEEIIKKENGSPFAEWSPFREINKLQEEVNQFFSNSLNESGIRNFPPLNVWSDQDKLTVTVQLPGVDPNDIEISLEEQNLTLKGSQKCEEPKNEGAFLRREIPSGEFARTLRLPYRVDANSTEANYKNGLLIITLKRPEEEKPKKISVCAK
ncbi:MAG: Hsp20/alpha crystallin family protein [Nitrospinales bacterium]